MTPLFKIFIALTVFLSANIEFSAQNRNLNNKKENVITKTVKTEPYNIIQVSGPMDVYLEKGTEGNIEVTAQANVQDKIVVKSDGETLTISMVNNVTLHNFKKIKITIPFEDISEISMRGSGVVESNDVLEGNALSLNLLGSGSINVKVESNAMDAKVHGSGEIQVSGRVKDMEVKTTGSGNFSGKELVAENAQIYLSGSGDVTVFAKSSLKARIQGSGTIYYLGNPSSNDVKVIGSGKVKSL